LRIKINSANDQYTILDQRMNLCKQLVSQLEVQTDIHTDKKVDCDQIISDIETKIDLCNNQCELIENQLINCNVLVSTCDC
jgi:translation initiation factor 2B subunit (eIF-2B alpha/beta/delta family)